MLDILLGGLYTFVPRRLVVVEAVLSGARVTAMQRTCTVMERSWNGHVTGEAVLSDAPHKYMCHAR